MRLALLAAALLLAALAIRSAPLGGTLRHTPAIAVAISRPPALAITPRPVGPVVPEADDPLATLPPEDIDWVLDNVERAESVRVLDDAQRARLIAQLISVRMHDVEERTELYVVTP